MINLADARADNGRGRAQARVVNRDESSKDESKDYTKVKNKEETKDETKEDESNPEELKMAEEPRLKPAMFHPSAKMAYLRNLPNAMRSDRPAPVPPERETRLREVPAKTTASRTARIKALLSG